MMPLRFTALFFLTACALDTDTSRRPADTDTSEETAVPADTSEPGPAPWPDPTTVASSLIQSGVITCPTPLDRIETPYEVLVEGTDWGLPHEWMDNEPGIISAAGVAVADLNGDGHEDLFFTGRKSVRLYLSTGPLQFTDATELLPDTIPNKSASATAVDVDADGDLDLFVGGYKTSNVLLVNDGTGVFSDGTQAAGFTAHDYRTVGSSWADFDGDGDLDVYIANYGTPQQPADPSLLYENDGTGHFELSDCPPCSRRRWTHLYRWMARL